MIWTDILVDNEIPDWKVCKVLHDLLKIPLDKIQVIEDYDDFPDADTMNVICQKSLFSAGFVMMLSIYLFGEITKNIPKMDEFVSGFSKLLNCKCLLPSEHENPSQMFLFEGAKKRLVYLDERSLENDGIYTLKK